MPQQRRAGQPVKEKLARKLDDTQGKNSKCIIKAEHVHVVQKKKQTKIIPILLGDLRTQCAHGCTSRVDAGSVDRRTCCIVFLTGKPSELKT